MSYFYIIAGIIIVICASIEICFYVKFNRQKSIDDLSCDEYLLSLLPEHLKDRNYRGTLPGRIDDDFIRLALAYYDGDKFPGGDIQNVGFVFDRKSGELVDIEEDGIEIVVRQAIK